MKRLLFLLAVGFVIQYENQPTIDVSGNIILTALVGYTGSGVGTFQQSDVAISLSGVTTAAQFQTAVCTAMQNDATSKGFTVPAGSCFVPSYAKL